MTCEIPTQQRAKAPRPPIMDAPTGRRPHDAQHALALFLPHPPRPDHHLHERAGRARSRVRRGAACWHPAPDGAFEPLRHRASGILCWEAHRLRRPARPRGDRVPEKRVGSAFPRALRHFGHQRRYRARSGETEVIPRCWGRGERKPTRRDHPRPSVVRANGRPIAADARGRIREGLLHMERERAGA